MQYLVIANYGNDSIALLQWLIENHWTNVQVLSVDTGMMAKRWQARVDKAETYLKQNQLKSSRLSAPLSFQDSVIDRGQFPSQKFQWCASFLKGLTINEFLDEHDPMGEWALLFAKRKAASRSHFSLEKQIESSEYFDGRRIEYPLYDLSLDERNALIDRAGFELLPHRSLECEPCIHATKAELAAMEESDIRRLDALEKTVDVSMFSESFLTYQKKIRHENAQPLVQNLEAMERGCGSTYGCGE